MRERSDDISPDVLRRNLKRVQERIAAAAARAGRRPEDVRLVAVTKYTGVEQIRALIEMGVADIGESRVQDAEKKHKALGEVATRARWHLIGHLQTNKADKAAKMFQTVHSVDSTRVAEALNREAAKRSSQLECLIEVNVAGEANKFGMKPDANEIGGVLKSLATCPALRVKGLMTMAPFADDSEPVARPVFKRLRELLQDLNTSGSYPQPLTELSMGMTQDFEIAIEEGSTIVRVGSALLEK
ncbi:MAG TPA: YggS family pyridoxal phosphate-dependent enzyme [Planctomycetota bacterium]|nr:YggS family pyridoxal phosphate-dependent enzyme [Planctomycetota bacterium]